MANKKLNMRKVRELLRLRFQQDLSNRHAAKTVGIGKTAASEYISGFRKSWLTLDQAVSLSEKDLLATLNIHTHRENPRYEAQAKLFPYIEKELKRTSVTLQILWQEYREGYPDGYEYSQYCHHFISGGPQRKFDWIQVNENALRFFGGMPRAIVPDCLKSAVKTSDRYEPQINETYQDLARHFNTVILPARALHPKDKALAENFVK